MKKVIALFLSIIMSIMLFGCNVADKGSDINIDEGNDELTLDELDRLAEKGDSGAETIALFIRKNGSELCKISSPWPGISYDFLNNISFGNYSVSATDDGGYDLRFTVTKSSSNILKQGEYRYSVSGRMWSPKGYTYDAKYDGLVEIIEYFEQFQCVSWENGEPTECPDWFDYAVFQTVLKLSSDSPYVSDDCFIENDYLQRAARELFCIEDYEPQSIIISSGGTMHDIFVCRDGAWGIWPPNVVLVPMSEVVEVREINGKIEVDVQYYADTCKLIPAQKVTVYVSYADNADFEYCFEKALTVDRTDYDIYYVAY